MTQSQIINMQAAALITMTIPMTG